MTERFLDDLARELAQPMPRRRAVRLLGATVAVAMFPSLRPQLGRAAASITCGKGEEPCSSATGLKLCMPAGGTCCWFTPEDSGYEPWGLLVGCSPGTHCGSAKVGRVRCVPNKRCRRDAGLTQCGNACCDDKTEFCASRQRSLCCKKSEKVCATDESATCCNKQSTCCGDKCCKQNQLCGSYGPASDRFYICCKTRACQAGAGTKPFCCPRRTDRCVPGIQGGGVQDDAVRVCCPADRVVTGSSRTAVACCPEGTVSLGEGLSVGAGVAGVCCPKEQACRSGTKITCCAKSSEAQSQCCSGTCTDVRFDTLNCGACGTRCEDQKACRNGVCVSL